MSAKEPVVLINRQFKELAAIYREAVKQIGISESEFWIWYTLIAAKADYTQQDICNMLSLPKQTVNTVITHMRLKKYAYLEAIPGTRNHKFVRLTDEGKAFGEAMIKPISAAEDKAFEMIPEEEITSAVHIFEKYIETVRGQLSESSAMRHSKKEIFDFLKR